MEEHFYGDFIGGGASNITGEDGEMDYFWDSEFTGP